MPQRGTATTPAEYDMGYYVERLKRPYDFRVLIEAYVYAQRKDFVHEDFSNYYVALSEALQKLFGVRLSEFEGLNSSQRAFWMLFRSTVPSLLAITDPWANFLEDTLLTNKLEASGEPGKVVMRARAAIIEGNELSKAAHRDILYAMFKAMYGNCDRIVTSEELLRNGFDDSREPDSSDYYDYL